MYTEYFGLLTSSPIEPTMRYTGDFIKHCIKDLFTEYESDIISSGIEWKKYNGALSRKIVLFLKDAILKRSEELLLKNTGKN